jgi:hypothetical protein
MAKALSTSARELYDCPRCGAAKGNFCTSPKGRKLRDAIGGIHSERFGLVLSDPVVVAAARIVKQSN